MLNRRRRWSTDTKSVLGGDALSGDLGFGTMKVGEVALEVEVLEVLSVVLGGGVLEVLSVVLIGLIPSGSVLLLVLSVLSVSGCEALF